MAKNEQNGLSKSVFFVHFQSPQPISALAGSVDVSPYAVKPVIQVEVSVCFVVAVVSRNYLLAQI